MDIHIPSTIHALIFDIDGTIADTMPLHFRAWQKACTEYKFPFPKQFFLDTAGMPTNKIIDKINALHGLNLDAHQVLTFKYNFFLSHIHEIKPLEPIARIVRDYSTRKKIAYGTGSNRFMATKILHACNLYQFADIIITSDDVQHHKPHPDTFLTCAKQLNINPQYCQVFEDADLGLKAAIAAGMQATDIRLFCKTH